MITVEGLKKHYRMGGDVVSALDGVDFHIAENEFVAVMGPSGSGKSTLMNILGCLDQPTAGKYFLANKEVSGLDDDTLAEVRNTYIGFVFQTFHLQPRLSALKNVMLPLRYSQVNKEEGPSRAEALLKRVGLGDRMDHRPSELSGGQRQRVAVARALVNNPKVIFADEPTGNLDSKTSEEIMGLFEELHLAGQTIMLVTHEEEIAKHAQKIIRMKDGRIQEIEHV